MTQRPQHPTHNVHPTRPTHAPGNEFNRKLSILVRRAMTISLPLSPLLPFDSHMFVLFFRFPSLHYIVHSNATSDDESNNSRSR